jgi:hypothetical protein
MMLQFSQPQKPPPRSDSDFEAWREYASRVSQAIRERREDAYEDNGRNDAGHAKVMPLRRNSK